MPFLLDLPTEVIVEVVIALNQPTAALERDVINNSYTAAPIPHLQISQHNRATDTLRVSLYHTTRKPHEHLAQARRHPRDIPRATQKNEDTILGAARHDI
jgi:hypothetical protein